MQASPLGAGKLHQFFRHAHQAFEGGLDLGRALSGSLFRCLGADALGLGNGTCNRRAKLVRGIGRKGALGIERFLQAVEQLIDASGNRS